MVAIDWRGSKDIYREWSKMRVEVLLGGANGDNRGEEEIKTPRSDPAFGAPAVILGRMTLHHGIWGGGGGGALDVVGVPGEVAPEAVLDVGRESELVELVGVDD